MPGPTATTPKLWLKGDVCYNTGTTQATDGQTVATWPDQSGNGNDATAGDAPTFRANALNSLGVIEFNSTSNYFDSAYTGEPATVLCLCRAQAFSTDRTICGADTSDAVAVGAYYFKPSNSSGKSEFTRCTSNDTTGGTDLTAQAVAMRSIWFILGGRINSNTIEIYKNELLCSSDTYTPGSLRTITSPVIGCGWYNDTRVDFFDGFIAELLIYDSVLSTTEFEEVVDYLLNRWGLSYPANQNYFFPTFHGGDERLVMLVSDDGLNWIYRPSDYVPSTGSVRDPSIYDNGSGTWWMVHTNGSFNDSTTFTIAKSTDGGYLWEHVATIDCSAVANGLAPRVWAPEWARNIDNTIYLDSGDGRPRVVVSITPDWDGGAGTFTPCEVHPTTGDGQSTDWGGWSSPTVLTGTSLSNCIDMYPFFDGADWHAYVKEDPSDIANGNVERWKSSTSLTAGWTVEDATQPTGWGTGVEGPSIINVEGILRAYFDAPEVALYYSNADSTDPETTSWTNRSAVTHPFLDDFTPRHGSIMAPAVEDPQTTWRMHANPAPGTIWSLSPN